MSISHNLPLFCYNNEYMQQAILPNTQILFQQIQLFIPVHYFQVVIFHDYIVYFMPHTNI